MKQYNLNVIQANSSNELISKLSKERIKKHCKSPDITRMHTVEVPSLRLTYFCKSLAGVAKRIKAIKETYPDREIITNKLTK
jgi:hypothetical protein